jgi:hypothetical protein
VLLKNIIITLAKNEFFSFISVLVQHARISPGKLITKELNFSQFWRLQSGCLRFIDDCPLNAFSGVGMNERAL